MKNIIHIIQLVLVACILIAILPINSVKLQGGSVGAGFQSQIATSSTVQVGPQQNQTLFSSKTQCASRTISTLGNPIMVSFGGEITPAAGTGHIQAASTSVNYDSALYGCGAWTAYGFTATTTVTVTEQKF